jgi:hypothetical protein
MHIEKSIFKVLDSKRAYTHVYYFQSWYSPIFLKSRHDNDAGNSTCITFEVRKDKEGKRYLVLANVLKPSILDSHEVIIHAKNLNNDFTNNSLDKLPNLHNQRCIIVPGNDNINNIFASALQKDNLPIRRLYIENNGIDLEGLVHQAIKIVRNNGFFILPKPKVDNTLRTIDKDFMNMIATYPNSESYSLCYAWAQGLVYADKYLYLYEHDSKRPIKRDGVNHGYGVES